MAYDLSFYTKEEPHYDERKRLHRLLQSVAQEQVLHLYDERQQAEAVSEDCEENEFKHRIADIHIAENTDRLNALYAALVEVAKRENIGIYSNNTCKFVNLRAPGDNPPQVHKKQLDQRKVVSAASVLVYIALAIGAFAVAFFGGPQRGGTFFIVCTAAGSLFLFMAIADTLKFLLASKKR